METKKSLINNAFYDTLRADWLSAENHPIALLRAENRLRNPWIIQTIQNKKPGPCRILDIGCGAGLLTNPLAVEGHVVTGIDLSASSLDTARQTDGTKSVDYQVADAERLPYDNGVFDVVCAMDLLEHVEDPEAVTREASRVLKPGGLFFFHTFNRNWLSYFIIIKGVEWFVENAPDSMHVHSLFIKPSELDGWCADAGMETETLIGMRPDYTTRSFWKMVFKGTVDQNFRFVFTPSLLTGYVGFAKKDSPFS